MDPSIQFTDAKPNASQGQAGPSPLVVSGGGADGWSCPRCGAINSPSGQFCHKCGNSSLSQPVASPPQTTVNFGSDEGNRRSYGKIILVFLILVILIAGGAAGTYYYLQKKQKDEARNYLKFEGSAFGNSINFVNSLSTEKPLEDTDDNDDLFLKKLEDEKNRSDQVLADIRVTKTKNSQAKSNKLVAQLDGMLKDYYDLAEKYLLNYDQCITYETETQRIMVDMKRESDKIETIFKTAKTPEDFVKAMKSVIKNVDDANAKIKQLTPPPGYEEIQKKDTDHIDKMISLLNDFVNAISSKNEEKLIAAMDNLDEFFSVTNDKFNKDMRQMLKYQYDQLHQKFIDLRQKADEIRNELIKANTVYNFDLKNISIEGW